MRKKSTPAPAKAPPAEQPEQPEQETLSGSTSRRPSAPASPGKGSAHSPAAIDAFVQQLGDRDANVAGTAAQALRELGRDAVPPLLAALRDPCAKWVVLKAVAQNLANLLPDNEVHRLVKDLLCGDSRSQCEAAEAIGGLGEDAREAVPALLWSMRKAQAAKVREASAKALGRLGPLTPEVIPALVQALEGDPVVPPAAPPPPPAETATKPKTGGTAFPRLAAEPKTHADAGGMAAEALGKIGTPEAIESLLRSLRKHPDANVRTVVATSLGAVVPPVPAAVGPLVEALNDDSPAVREAATRALLAIGETAIAELTAALHHDLPEVKGRAAATLARLAPGSWLAIDALAKALEDPDSRVAVPAAVAILKIFEANPTVRATCQQKREQHPKRYVPEDQRALTMLAGVVQRKDGDRKDRQQAAEALGRIGPGAKSASPILAEVAADESDDRLVRGSARWALQRIGTEEAAKPKA